VDIKVTCEHCGHEFTVSKDTAGQQGQCPECGNSVYIPTPEDEIEELPLAPEDDSDRQREEQLQEERRHVDRMLSTGEEGQNEANAGLTPPAEKPADSGKKTGRKKSVSLREAVLGYLTALRDSDLDRADEYLKLLQSKPDDALKFVDRLINDQIPPSELSDLAPGVYQGFLKKLSSQLS